MKRLAIEPTPQNNPVFGLSTVARSFALAPEKAALLRSLEEVILAGAALPAGDPRRVAPSLTLSRDNARIPGIGDESIGSTSNSAALGMVR